MKPCKVHFLGVPHAIEIISVPLMNNLFIWVGDHDLGSVSRLNWLSMDQWKFILILRWLSLPPAIFKGDALKHVHRVNKVRALTSLRPSFSFLVNNFAFKASLVWSFLHREIWNLVTNFTSLGLSYRILIGQMRARLIQVVSRVWCVVQRRWG